MEANKQSERLMDKPLAGHRGGRRSGRSDRNPPPPAFRGGYATREKADRANKDKVRERYLKSREQREFRQNKSEIPTHTKTPPSEKKVKHSRIAVAGFVNPQAQAAKQIRPIKMSEFKKVQPLGVDLISKVTKATLGVAGDVLVRNSKGIGRQAWSFVENVTLTGGNSSQLVEINPSLQGLLSIKQNYQRVIYKSAKILFTPTQYVGSPGKVALAYFVSKPATLDYSSAILSNLHVTSHVSQALELDVVFSRQDYTTSMDNVTPQLYTPGYILAVTEGAEAGALIQITIEVDLLGPSIAQPAAAALQASGAFRGIGDTKQMILNDVEATQPDVLGLTTQMNKDMVYQRSRNQQVDYILTLNVNDLDYGAQFQVWVLDKNHQDTGHQVSLSTFKEVQGDRLEVRFSVASLHNQDVYIKAELQGNQNEVHFDFKALQRSNISVQSDIVDVRQLVKKMLTSRQGSSVACDNGE